jgi:acetoin utilization deacetylase AcuC-like enzyme
MAGVHAAGVDVIEEQAAPASMAVLERVHDRRYLDRLLAPRHDVAMLDPDTYITPGSSRAARESAGAAISAVEASLRGDVGIAASRPPGHHALPGAAMGFCLLANIAVAVRHAQAALGVGRVAVVDIDVHHGNGTQAVFWDDPTVLAVSLHEWPRWPFTGAAQERGGAAARGATLNIPLPTGTGGGAYLSRFEAEALPAVEAFTPDLIVVACGFDADRRDPLAGLELEPATFGAVVGACRALCGRLRITPPVLCLEGGYDLDAVREGATAVTQAAADRSGSA